MSSTCTTWLQSVASVGRLGEGASPVRAIRPMATGGNATGAGGISVGAFASSMETRKVLADVSGNGIVTGIAVVVVTVAAVDVERDVIGGDRLAPLDLHPLLLLDPVGGGPRVGGVGRERARRPG